MNTIALKFSVVFVEPFWVGICEKVEDGQLSVCKVTFGSEPKDYEVKDFILENWYAFNFGPTVKAEVSQNARINFKRMQRAIKKQVQTTEIGTKSQQALKLQQENTKVERKTRSREQKLEDKQRKFDLKQDKKKEKHRGR
jgi:hypothetical protein